MKSIINKITAIILTLTVSNAFAQQLPVISHHIYLPNLYNPARTGQNDFGSVAINFKKQWVQMPQSPITGILNFETPLGEKKNMGFGGMIYTDQMHIIANVGALLTYAYHVRFDEAFKHRLSFGMSMGFLNRKFNFAEAQAFSANDVQLLVRSVVGTSFDFSFGVDYQLNNLHVGGAMLQGLNNSMKFIVPNDTNTIKFINSRHFLLTASYKYYLGKEEDKHRMYLKPVFLGRIVPALPFQAEVSVLYGLNKIGWIGFGYRSSNMETATSALSFTAGVEVTPQINAAYTVDVGINKVVYQNMGLQHELMLSYAFGKDDKKDKELEDLKEKNKAMEENILMKSDSLAKELDGQKKKTDDLEKSLNDVKKENDELKAKVLKNEEEIEALKKQLSDKGIKPKNVGEIYFDPNSDKINDASKPQLDALKKYLDEFPHDQVTIHLHGNADTEPEADLASRRGQAINDYLRDQGVNAADINVVPMAAHNPSKDKGTNPENRIDIQLSQDGKSGNGNRPVNENDPEAAPQGTVYKVQVSAVRNYNAKAYDVLQKDDLSNCKLEFEEITGARRVYLVPSSKNADGTQGFKSKEEAFKVMKSAQKKNKQFKGAFVIKAESGQREIIKE